MASTTAHDGVSRRASSSILWVMLLGLGAYFVVKNVPHYFIVTEQSYGPYFWPRAGYLLAHIVGGLTAIVIGPFQFWSKIRASHPHLHRTSGRIYLISILVGSIGGLGLAFTIPEGLAYASGLAFLAVAWLMTSGMAFLAIRNRNFVQHQQWMIRSYVVTFAFVSFRIVDDILHAYGLGEIPGHNAMLAWGCWAIPLLITETILQGRQIFRAR